ncbi:putative thioredoxin [Apiospora arundinis]
MQDANEAVKCILGRRNMTAPIATDNNITIYETTTLVRLRIALTVANESPELLEIPRKMSGTVNISSQGEWQRILGSSTIVVADFYADWCGPCKMVAPTFESLSTKFSKPGKITFCKVNVDNQQPIASAHGVRAMPTFLIFKNGSAVKLAGPGGASGGGAQGAVFKTPGRTLGGPGSRGSGGQRLSRPWSFSPFAFFNAFLTFFGLYFASLFSFDPYKAAEASDFNVHKPRNAVFGRGNGPRDARVQGEAARPTGGVRTLADLGGS